MKYIALSKPSSAITPSLHIEKAGGISLKWDYENITGDCSMPGYIEKSLHCFQHPTQTRPHHAPPGTALYRVFN
jgi:hypothetical protein